MGQVWDLIASIPDLCTLTYFVLDIQTENRQVDKQILLLELTTLEALVRRSNYLSYWGGPNFTPPIFFELANSDRFNINVLRQTACLVVNQSRLATLLSSLITRRRVGPQTL